MRRMQWPTRRDDRLDRVPYDGHSRKRRETGSSTYDADLFGEMVPQLLLSP